jgi:VWFA-related protein
MHAMKQEGCRAIALLVVLLFAAALLLAQAPTGPLPPKPGVPVQQPPKNEIKVQVALVTTPVTVRDSRGDMVHNLEAKDLRVTDQGIAQKISHFDLGGDPISLVILVETSSRIEPLAPEIRKTGILFTQTVMGPTGEAAVVGFNDSVDKLQDFTSSADQIESTITNLRAGTSGLKLFDAMAVGVEMLTSRPQASAEKPGRRRVMLVLSEGVDEGSEKQLGEVLRQAQLANVTVYGVGLSTTRAEFQSKPNPPQRPNLPVGSVPPPPGVPATPTYEDNYRYGGADLMAAVIWAVQHIHDKVKGNPLEVAAAATGGAQLSTFKDRSIENAIDEIGGELHSQYTLSYTPTDANMTGYHEIKVSVLRNDAKNLKIRARPGYYLASPDASPAADH